MSKEDKSIVGRVYASLFKRSSKGGQPVDLHHLTRLVRRYSVEQQQVPKDLSELVTLNYIETIPAAPPGLKFVIDRTGVEVRLE
jgi:hypothetical protein